ncbi:hypothetical protein JTE90_015693 [Oedothorax gibbosus]|uniref:RNA-directed DNA polymerase n=1 Tax=Oedothorax gibbosus TaxID=931172 RepID=A0AAV6TS00_9ARAC|nr:hypothetical protein JTE90_015693 [Oedothorax gibbosus]
MVEDRRVKLEGEKEAENRAYELEKLRITQVADISLLPSGSGENFRPVKNMKYVMQKYDPENSDMVLFLTLFERQARKAKIEETKKLDDYEKSRRFAKKSVAYRPPEKKVVEEPGKYGRHHIDNQAGNARSEVDNWKGTSGRDLNWRDREFERRRPAACYQCNSTDHLRPQCPELRRQNTERVNNINSVGKFGLVFAPYLSQGRVNSIETTILRDSGTSIDVAPAKLVNPEDCTGEVVWVKQALENNTRCLPIARIVLEGAGFGCIQTKAAIVDNSVDMEHYLLGNYTQELIDSIKHNSQPLNVVVTQSQVRREKERTKGEVKLGKEIATDQGEFKVIPEEVRPELQLPVASGSKCQIDSGGHTGVTKTKDKLLRYYWPQCTKDADVFVKTCEPCQRVGKAQETRKAPIKLVPIIKEVFSRVCIDTAEPLPCSGKGNRHLVTALCVSSTYPEAVPVADIRSETVTDALLLIFSRWGFPKVGIGVVFAQKWEKGGKKDTGLEKDNKHADCLNDASELEEVEAKYYQLKTALRKLTKISYQPQSSDNVADISYRLAHTESQMVSISQRSISEVKMPRLNIPIFTGDFFEWPSFKDLLCAVVHDNANLSKIEKFQYLKSLLADTPATLIRHMPMAESSYDEAWNKIVQRYGKNKKIVTSLITTFLSQPKITNATDSALRKLADTTDVVIRGLKTLHENAASRDPWLIHLLLEKVDQETCRVWAEKVAEEDFPTVESFIEFLNNCSYALEISNPKIREDKTVNKTRENPESPATVPDRSSSSTTLSLHLKQEPGPGLLSTAVVLVIDASQNKQTARVLLDSASERTFVSETCVRRVVSRYHPEEIAIEAYVLSKLTSNLPPDSLSDQTLRPFLELPLADPNFMTPQPVDIIIGADYFLSILQASQITNDETSLIAQNSKFGWIISGKILSSENLNPSFFSYHISSYDT